MFPAKNRATTTLTWFGSLVLIMSFAVVLMNAGSALAANISYIGSDGNVWRMSPDGALKEKLTGDGTKEARYKTPSQENDGTVVAVRRADAASSTAFAYFLRPSDKKLINSWILPKTGAGSFAPFNGGVISPEGGAFFYDWSYFDCWTNPCSSDFKVSVITGPGVTNPCLVNCHSGFFRPRWIPGTPYAGFVDDHLQGVWVQGEGQAEPRFWLGFQDTTSGNVESFDISAGKSVIETTPEDGERSEFSFWDNNGTPPAGNPAIRCSVAGVAKSPAYPRLSPDGTQVTWQDTDGVYVAPVPAQTGGTTCRLNGKQVVAGGLEPGWGKVSLKGAGTAPDPDPGQEPDRNRGVSIGAASLAKSKLKPGKATILRVKVSAGAAQSGVKACATVPKADRKEVKTSCRAVGNLTGGATATTRLRIRATGKARGRYRITARVTAAGTPAATRTVALKVRR